MLTYLSAQRINSFPFTFFVYFVYFCLILFLLFLFYDLHNNFSFSFFLIF